MTKKHILLNDKGKAVQGSELEKLSMKFNKSREGHNRYALGFIHASLDEEGVHYLEDLMTNALFFGLYLAKEGYVSEIKTTDPEAIPSKQYIG